MLGRDVPLVGLAEAPNFIALHALCLDVADRRILVLGASISGVDQKLCNGVDRDASNPSDRAHAHAFDKQLQDLCALLNRQDVHGNPSSIWISLILTNNLLAPSNYFVRMLSIIKTLGWRKWKLNRLLKSSAGSLPWQG